jgi:hypothetical protein
MSFWTDSTGTAMVAEKEFSAGGGDFEVIPKGTNCLVTVEDVGWKAGYQVSEEFVNLKLRVLKPEGYANRVIFSKLWVDELDPGVKEKSKAETKRDKHKRMLMSIDTNHKGKLASATSRPTNQKLSLALIGAQFVATLGVWEKEEDGRKVPGGNWLQAVGPKTKEVSAGPQVRAKARPMTAADDYDDDDGLDVPF